MLGIFHDLTTTLILFLAPPVQTQVRFKVKRLKKNSLTNRRGLDLKKIVMMYKEDSRFLWYYII